MARLQTVRSGIRIPIWTGDFFLLQNLPTVSGGAPSLLFIGYLSSYSGVKRLGLEVSNWFPSGAEVKEQLSYKPNPQVCHHGVDRDTLPYIFLLCVCTLHCYVIIKCQLTKCIFPKLIFYFFLVSFTFFEPEGSSSGRRLYLQLWYVLHASV